MAMFQYLTATLLLFTIVVARYRSVDPCAPNCVGQEGNYPHPQDCTLYYQCAQGTPVLQHCAGGLHFNPITHSCDYPASAGCTADPEFNCGGDPTTTTTPTYPTTTTTEERTTPTSPPTTTLSNTSPRPSTTTAEETTTQGGITPTVSTPDTTPDSPTTQSPVSTTDPSKCIPPCPYKDALYPNPRDCSTFFHCFGLIPFLQYCPPNQEYSLELERCDWPEVAKCEASDDTPCVALTNPPEEITTTSAPTGSTSDTTCVPPCPYEDALYPNPRDCSSYFHCSGLIPFLKYCPPNQEYSLEFVRCDWPEVAKCEASDDTPCVALTNPPEEITTTSAPTGSTSDTTCVPPCPYEDALYPNPRDCSTFFHCYGLIPFLQYCPPNQEYSLELARCDWPELAKCEASDDTPCVALTNPPEY